MRIAGNGPLKAVSIALLLGLLLAACKTTESEVIEEDFGEGWKSPPPGLIHEDYAQFVAESRLRDPFPPIAASVRYYLDPKTDAYRHEVRAASWGYWDVEFGRVLDAYL